MALKATIALVLCASASGRLLSKRTQGKGKLDFYQKAYVEGEPVLGDGVGFDELNVCKELLDRVVAHPNQPIVKVCGTGIKMTVYLLGRCGGGALSAADMAHTWDVGACDTTKPAETCDVFSPAADKRFGAVQSYMVTQCNVMCSPQLQTNVLVLSRVTWLRS